MENFLKNKRGTLIRDLRVYVNWPSSIFRLVFVAIETKYISFEN